MRKRVLTAALLAAFLLSGCGLLRDSYLSVSEHNDPYAYSEQTEPPTEPEPTEPALQSASNYYAIKSILRSFVVDGVEHGSFLLEDYSGDPDEELQEAFDSIKTEDPIGAYAVDYMEYGHTEQDGNWLVTVDAVYRRSASEIEAIQSVRGNDRAMELIQQTIDQFGTAVTLQISGYQEADLAGQIRRYCLEHPNVVVEMPTISASLYPEQGNVRVVELHFSYRSDRESLRTMQSEVDSVLASAERYVHYATDDRTKLGLLYTYLTSRFPYAEDPENGSVYRLLCEGFGSSESFAAVTAYLCGRIGLECQIVEGTRYDPAQTDEEGLPLATDYVWNVVQIDGAYYHVDLQACALERAEECRLLTDAEMDGYEWERENYPVCAGPIPEETEPETQTP